MSSKVGETHRWFPCLIDQVELPSIPHVVEYANPSPQTCCERNIEIHHQWMTHQQKQTHQYTHIIISGYTV